jgi:ankyrin repeat protein
MISSALRLQVVYFLLILVTVARSLRLNVNFHEKDFDQLGTSDSNDRNKDAVLSHQDNALQNVSGITALMTAAFQGEYEIMRNLVNEGASVDDVMYDQGPTALYFAVEARRLDMVQLLLENGATVDRYNRTFEVAVLNNDLNIVKVLLEAGADINLCMPDCILLAAGEGNYDILKLLIDRGVDVDAVRNEKNNTALHLAANFGHSKVVELLVESGADTNLKNYYGYTPLILAISEDIKEMVKILLDSNADINTPLKTSRESDNEVTPLLLAVMHERTDIVKMLLCRSDININFANSRNRTALDYAMVLENKAIARVLIMHGATSSYLTSEEVQNILLDRRPWVWKKMIPVSVLLALLLLVVLSFDFTSHLLVIFVVFPLFGVWWLNKWW